MHKLFASDISTESLKKMKKRIQGYRATKSNSGSDSFRAFELNFYENCIDALLELKTSDNKVKYSDVAKKLQSSVDDFNVNNHVLVKPLIDSEVPFIGNDYVLWDNVELFTVRFAYFFTESGGIGGNSCLYIILKNDMMFKCKSHRSITESIDSDAVVATYIGSLSVKLLDKIRKPGVSIHHSPVMDSIDFTIQTVVNGVLYDCIGDGSAEIIPMRDVDFYKSLLEDCKRLCSLSNH